MQDRVLLDITSKINRLSNNKESNTSRINDTNTIEIILNINDIFEDQNMVDVIVNIYMKQKGFVAIKYRKNLDEIDKIIV